MSNVAFASGDYAQWISNFMKQQASSTHPYYSRVGDICSKPVSWCIRLTDTPPRSNSSTTGTICQCHIFKPASQSNQQEFGFFWHALRTLYRCHTGLLPRLEHYSQMANITMAPTINLSIYHSIERIRECIVTCVPSILIARERATIEGRVGFCYGRNKRLRDCIVRLL